MYPIDCITEEDYKTMSDWINGTVGAKVSKSEIKELTLKEWNKNKIKLFKLFGQKLRIKIPYSRKVDRNWIRQEINSSFYFPTLAKSRLDNYISFGEDNFRPIGNFAYETLYFFLDLYKNKKISADELFNFSLLFSTNNLINNTLNESYYAWWETFKNIDEKHNEILFKNSNKKRELRISLKTKTLRAIGKILKYYDFPYMKDFEKWQTWLSTLCTVKEYKTNLVLSIHPIDFMTSSDNASGWTSCMNWRDDGGYSSGTIEMMNSNMVIIAYLENNSKPFIFLGNKMPNKIWRTYFYINKDILCSGLSYPNCDNLTTHFILDYLKDLLKNKFNWKYQYNNEEYMDMLYLDGEAYNKDSFFEYSTKDLSKGHSIILITNEMYNDIGSHPSETFICCRNWVKTTKLINLSGKRTCVKCGKPIEEKQRATKKLCVACENKLK